MSEREEMLADDLLDDIRAATEYWSDWLVDAVATATQDRRFLRGEPEEDRIATEAILLNGKKAIKNAIAALPAPAGVEVTVEFEELSRFIGSFEPDSDQVAHALLSRFTILAKPEAQEGQGS